MAVAAYTRNVNGTIIFDFNGSARFFLDILDFPAAAAVSFGKIRAHLKAAGTPIGNYDLLIAAHALHAGLTLVTNNVREFLSVPGLRVEDWVSSAT